MIERVSRRAERSWRPGAPGLDKRTAEQREVCKVYGMNSLAVIEFRPHLFAATLAAESAEAALQALKK